MKEKIVFLIMAWFASSFSISLELSKKMNKESFCKLIGEDCVNNKCNYYEECPSALAHKCGIKKCTINKYDCMAYLKVESFLKSNQESIFYKKFGTVSATFKKIETEFHKFQAKIPNCKHGAYVWNSSDVCVLPKNCYEMVKTPSKSFMDFIFKQKEYQLIQIDCPCDLKHNYQCQDEFCTTSKKACNVFIEKRKEKIISSLQTCQYTK